MKRLICAGVIGGALAVLIWVVVPYNNYWFTGQGLVGNYLMPLSVLLMLVLVLGVNPLLSRLSPRRRLTGEQLALIYSIVFIAGVVPGTGFLRIAVFPLAQTVQNANTDASLAEAYAVMDPPASLFPDSLQYGAPIPVVEPFIGSLEPGERVPYAAWLAPLVSWSGFILPWFTMMTAMAVIFARYWREEERVAFPLLEVQQAIVELPEDGGRIPVLFGKTSFWVPCLIVLAIHSLNHGHLYLPDAVPPLPLSWEFWELFTELPFRNAGWWLKLGSIQFMYVGIAFLMPTRASFSIWFFQVAYAIYIMIRSTYFPPLQYASIEDHRIGAFIVFPLFVLWLARRHLARIARTLYSRAEGPDDRAYRAAAVALLLGLAGMFVWLLWAGVHPAWAGGLVTIGFLFGLSVTRLLAETGIPMFFPQDKPAIPIRCHADMSAE